MKIMTKEEDFTMRRWLAIILHVCLWTKTFSFTVEEPEFSVQPKPITYFSNSVGTTLQCHGGRGGGTVRWLEADGNPVQEIPGVREIVRNNSLHILPFRREDFLPSVHDASYRCSITNYIGTSLSPLFTMRAISDEPFEIFIVNKLDEGDIMMGNVAVLSCDVKPDLYKDFIKIIHWKYIDQYGHETEIEPNGNSYYVSSEGSLVVRSAKFQQLFICVAQNRLNNKIQSSPPFMLKSRAAVGRVPPTNVGKWQRMIFTEIGRKIDLFCLSIGNPPPTFRWEKLVHGKFIPVMDPKGRIWGPVLSVDGLTSNTTYRCEVVNDLGNFFLEMDIVVPLIPKLQLLPQKKVVRIGQNVELKCETRDVVNHAEITWFHNGRKLSGGDDGGDRSRIRISSRQLSILNIRFEDQGVYQCFMLSSHHHVGAQAVIHFPLGEPELLHTFSQQTLQPGTMVSLKCSAVGNPPPTFQWFVDGKIITNDEEQVDQSPWRNMDHRYSLGSYLNMNEIISFMNISNVRVEDSGEYKCLAKNYLSSVIHAQRLNVYGRPFVKEMGQMTLVAGTTARIPCLYGGYPVDEIFWKYNGSSIDMKRNKSKFRILANGTLQIESIKPGSDKGQYSCTVTNRNGETASGAVSINVLRPPVISPFSFDDNLQEGQRTSAACNVISGDLPIDIVWLKDFQPIPFELNVTPMRMKFLSSLIFEELKGVHSGTYTCSASNAAKTATFSAQLLVKGPPTWSHEPLDSQALLQSDVIIPCHAKGMPEPKIRWLLETSITRAAIRPDHKFHIFDNGSLSIRNVDKNQTLICEATNGVGNGISKSIQLTVIIPAKVSAVATTVVIAEGLPAVLKCQIRGDVPIHTVWRKNSVVIEQSPRVILQTVLNANSTVQLAELKIQRTEKSDGGTYFCAAFNKYGRDEDEILLQVKARPRSPNALIVQEIGSRFIRLNWSLDTGNLSSDSDPVTHFVLEYKNSSAISWQSAADISNITVPAPSNVAILKNLRPAMNYEIRLAALNEVGRSLPTQPITLTTLPESPSAPPVNVSAVATTSTTILVRWKPPPLLLQNGAILGYHILISPASPIPLSNRSKVVDEKWNKEVEINELKPYSRYHVSVRAYNVAGVGPESPFLITATLEGSPDSPPVNIVCEPLSPKSLRIIWDPPPHHLRNGVVEGYKVIYSSVEAELQGERPEVKKTINRETTLHGLFSYTNYSIRTLAYTVGGESTTSDPLFCTTEEDLPDEPAKIKASQSAPNSIIVSWLRPSHPNGVVISYLISWKSKFDVDGVKEKYYAVSENEDQMLMEIRGLRDNTPYMFWVTAATSLGPGKSSQVAEILLTSKAPAKIVSFPLTLRPKLEESVFLPCKAGGFPLPEITWVKAPSLRASGRIMSNGTLVIPRVKEEQEGIYRCTAKNSFGTDEIHHEIFISKPPVSASLVLGYVTFKSIEVHWNTPKGQPPVTGYVLQYRSPSPSEWTSQRLGAKINSFLIDNLRCGTNYQVRIASQNAIGKGNFSPSLKTKTNGGPPQHPKLGEIIDGNGTMIRIDLSRWADGGCPGKFHLEFRQKDSAEWRTIHRNDPAKTFVLNTTLGTKYDFRMSLENDAGMVSKTFSVESSPEFFTSYDKLIDEEDAPTRVDDSVIAATIWFIVVPTISILICTAAVIICIVIFLKRRKNSNAWVNSEDFRMEKPYDKCKSEGIENTEDNRISVYATLNSRKAIPMTIRESTVRLHTFGQVDNYDAPPIPGTFSNRQPNNLHSCRSQEHLVKKEGFVPSHKQPDSMMGCATPEFRRVSNEYAIQQLNHDYAHPYQVVPVNMGLLEAEIYTMNTMRKNQRLGKRNSRGHVQQFD